MPSQAQILLLLSLPFSAALPAQSPFQFREAAILESKMFRSGENFSAIHSQSFGRQTPSATQQFIPDANDLQVYRSPRWLGLLNETDAYRRQGALLLAEKQYLDLLAKVRQAQGQNAVDAGWMLDHLGDFYLDAHDFDKAYQYFSDAIAVRRDNIQTLVPLAVPGKQDSINLLLICRAHLIKTLVLVARLDAAKGDFALADRKLQEAVALGNKMVRLQDGLDAIYFRSQILEKQGRWQEAEDLWKDALQARVKMTVSDPYWDLVKEMAAFYARHSDFHSAAALVKRIQTETAGKTLRPVMAIPESLEERQGRKPDNDFIAGMYKSESAIAMDEILAVDRWTADGPDAAAPLFDAPNLARTSNEENMLFGLGSDSRQARFPTHVGIAGWNPASATGGQGLCRNPAPQGSLPRLHSRPHPCSGIRPRQPQRVVH
jgi:tetratricopeptide (TPR) repeat protein